MPYSDTKMTIDDLECGDVLIFEASDHWDSWLVCLVTNSDVAHAAMLFHSKDQIVEQTPPQVRAIATKERLNNLGRRLYVMRANFASEKSLIPVMNEAQKHLNNKEPYPYINLIIGMLAAFAQAHTHDFFYKKTLLGTMRWLTWHFAKFVDDWRYGDDTEPMVCSEFVYRCFGDAGAEFNLDMQFDRQSFAFNNALKQSQPRPFIDIVTEKLSNTDHSTISNSFDEESLAAMAPEDVSADLKSQLKQLFSESNTSDNTSSFEAKISHEITSAGAEFIVTLARAGFFNSAQSTTAKYEITTEEALHQYREYIAMFIAPINLLRDCKNLNCIGYIDT